MSRSAYSTKLFALLGGFAGGIVAVLFILPFLVRLGVLDGVFFLGQLGRTQEEAAPKVEEKTVFIPRSDYFSDAIAKTEPRVAAVQSFSGGTLVRSGSGIVLTQDGLIGTLNSVVPSSQIIQVTASGKIYSGRVIFRNYPQNLAIISVSGSGFPAAELKSELPALGQKLLALAKTVNFSQDKPLVAEALVSQIDANDGGGQFKITTPYDQFMFGSALIDNSGSVLGILDFRNQKPLIIPAKSLEETLDAALTKK